jgi:pimeloyl-ACP methyl ester carboxylesterase/UDP:flavonoid glycosyltransferase YjiC (YdhE family)
MIAAAMRARQPDEASVVEGVDGIRIAYEVHGSGDPAFLLLPAWSIVHSRVWKLQVPYLARHHKVVTFDPRGNGESDSPLDPALHADAAYVGDALAVLDAAGVERAIVVGLSRGAIYGLRLAAEHPERVLGLVTTGAALPLGAARAERDVQPFEAEPQGDEGWATFNAEFWRRDFETFVRFFMGRCFTESHSTKPIEDAISWGMTCGPDALIATVRAPDPLDEATATELCRRVRCPVLAIHGAQDAIRPAQASERFAELTGAALQIWDGCGHVVGIRHPVRVNAELRAFAQRVAPRPEEPRRWRRALSRRRRALYMSSPIGLGHARRDIAVARELRALVPDLEIDWLAAEPTSTALRAAGERVHPMSGELASEAVHIDAFAAEHELWVFEAIRQMDEILLANYMVFRDLAHAEPYDLWIGDEAWELDYHLHENPEDKRAPFVWLTDFVGWLPLLEHGEREAELCADLNEEMIEHVERFPALRDRAIFVGDPEDIVPGTFGPGLPEIRAWTERHFDFCGHVTGYAHAEVADREALRAQLGYAGDAPVCLASVGGSAVAGSLLRRVAGAADALRERVPGARMVAVCGPRIDPATLGDGVEARGYVPDLHRHLAACDVALVHGGLTTGMELIASGRPFASFPLRRHFEQRTHVRHRLARHGHERVLEASDCDASDIAAAAADALARPPAYLPVPDDGAARAAALIAELL